MLLMIPCCLRPNSLFGIAGTKEASMQQAMHIDHHADILNAIIESSFDGLWICNGEGEVLKINKASEKINSITAEQVVGKNIRELVEQGIFDRSVTLEVLKNKKRASILQSLNNGKKLLVTGNPIFVDGELKYVVTNDRDITELIQLKEELEESREISKKFQQKLHDVLHKGIEDKEDFVFCSKEMKKVYEMIRKVAEVGVTVLLQGESGVGKSRIARLIHEYSERGKGPFIHVNCGAIPETLLESELFGYVKGAFTGAKKEGKQGMFELADGGTLFLDEITEMPQDLQVKLLHFLDSEKIKRVGDTVTRKINARIIVASNRDIQALVKNNKFREDLFFRVNIVPIEIPPLRNRKEDIPLLLSYFSERYNARYGKSLSFDTEVVDLLSQYLFPGNIRELSNLVERLVVMAHESIISKKDLPGHLVESVIMSPQGIDKNTLSKFSLKETIEKVERQLIENAGKICKTQMELANFLGISQPTVARKIQKHNL
jgi:PAS domain S-box-containing protein